MSIDSENQLIFLIFLLISRIIQVKKLFKKINILQKNKTNF